MKKEKEMAKTQAAKVTLSSGKVVILRMPKISDTELAAQEVALKSNGDGNLLQFLTQKALIKNLIMKIDDKDLMPVERENFDELFNMAEYNQLIKAVGKISGGDDLGKQAQVETMLFGD